ncbi:MAG: winged helix DNA-binding domain-containing protein [Gulosibacter sp.]|uniref:winged helix DNA-binding domain-containing protein n=1 Tax=Gulosibacter sp. TaxID=2817531 RepID=UPI003F8E9B77
MTDDAVTLSREQVLRYRWRAAGLDAEPDAATVTELASLDLGIQDGANAAGVIALVNRGVATAEAIRVTSGFSEELALTWTVRGAPHFLRRADVSDVQVAVSPYSEKDGRKRILAAAKDLQAAGIDALDGMRIFAEAMHDAVPPRGKSLSKGELSEALHEQLPDPYQVDCRPCQATHPHEQLFRLSALHSGLELEPGQKPPNLRRVPNLPRRKPGPAIDPLRASTHLQVIRAYLHLLGPATPREVAAYLETNVGEIKPHWPADAREVDVDGQRASVLEDDLPMLANAAEADAPQLRLLSGFDLVLAAKDRELLVPDAGRRKELWPVLGRPGVVAVDGELIGVWRPKSTKDRLTIRAELWRSDAKLKKAIEAQAERIAAAREQPLRAVDFSD